MMPVGPVNTVELDLSAIATNARVIRRHVGPDVLIVASLKSNAHGFGLIEVAQAVLRNGADAVAVVNLQDAQAIRHAGIGNPVLLYAGAVMSEAVADLIDELNLMPTVLDLESAKMLSNHSTRTLLYWVKLDVGLQRLGLAPDDLLDFVASAEQLPRMQLEGVYTHMHVISGRRGSEYLQWQVKRFTDAVRRLQDAGIRVPRKLAASSAVMIEDSNLTMNAIDPGRLFYGLLPAGPGTLGLHFEPAFRSLKSRLVQVKSLQRIEFNDVAPYPVRHGMRVGVFPLGRSDGMLALSMPFVLVRGSAAPILTRPSLEHTRIDLTDVPDARVGDEVVVIGSQGTQRIGPEQVAKHLDMDPGELAIGLRGSIYRQYIDVSKMEQGSLDMKHKAR